MMKYRLKVLKILKK